MAQYFFFSVFENVDTSHYSTWAVSLVVIATELE